MTNKQKFIEKYEKTMISLKPIPKKYLNGSVSELGWYLADGTTIEKVKPHTIFDTSKPVYAVFDEDGDVLDDTFDNFSDVVTYAKKVRKKIAEELYREMFFSTAAGHSRAVEIYNELKMKPLNSRRLALKKEVLRWSSRYAKKEYGDYATAIAKKLNSKYKQLYGKYAKKIR